MQAVEPETELYIPGMQFIHACGPDAPVLVEYVPATHKRQTAADVAASVVEKVPDVQLVQAVPPSTDDHVPGTQEMQLWEADAPIDVE